MRAAAGSLVPALLAASLVGAVAAGAEKPKSAPLPPPPGTLTLSAEITVPKLPPPPAPVAGAAAAAGTASGTTSPGACGALRKRLATLAVHFDAGSANLSPNALKEVAAIADAITASGVGALAEYSVEGHCEPTGPESANVAMSDRRADAVLHRLIALGAVSAGQAKAVGRGKQKPLGAAGTADAAARSRRVEVVVFCAVP